MTKLSNLATHDHGCIRYSALGENGWNAIWWRFTSHCVVLLSLKRLTFMGRQTICRKELQRLTENIEGHAWWYVHWKHRVPAPCWRVKVFGHQGWKLRGNEHLANIWALLCRRAWLLWVLCSVTNTPQHGCPKQKMKTFNAGSSSPGVSVCGWLMRSGSAPFSKLSLGSVNVIDGRQEFLASLLVYMWTQTNVHQVGELLHGVLLHRKQKCVSKKRHGAC